MSRHIKPKAGGGNRTRVLMDTRDSIYVRSPCFEFAALASRRGRMPGPLSPAERWARPPGNKVRVQPASGVLPVTAGGLQEDVTA